MIVGLYMPGKDVDGAQWEHSLYTCHFFYDPKKGDKRGPKDSELRDDFYNLRVGLGDTHFALKNNKLAYNSFQHTKNV